MAFRNKISKEKKLFAKGLRKNMTFTERTARQLLRTNFKEPGLSIRTQTIILGWIVDFYLPNKKLIIEIDSEFHDPTKDSFRDKTIYEHTGCLTYRIHYKTLLNNKEKFIQDLTNLINNFKITKKHPGPTRLETDK